MRCTNDDLDALGVELTTLKFSLDLGEGVIQQVEPNGAHVLQRSGRMVGMMYIKANYQVERGASGGNVNESRRAYDGWQQKKMPPAQTTLGNIF